jgi:hypothetical protein
MRIKEGATSKDFLKGNTARREEYTVWFEQVNAEYFTVKAVSQEEAIAKAERVWRKNIYAPHVTAVEKTNFTKP